LSNLILLSSFSLSFPIISIFSSGFGNGLVSFLFLLSIYFCLKKKLISSLLFSGLLPLVRPDGILWSFLSIITVAITFRKSLKLIYQGQKILYLIMLLLPLISILIYLLFYKSIYGHFIPTPILFKSFKLSMLPMFRPLQFCRYFSSILLRQPVNLIAFLVLASLFCGLINKQSWIEKHEIIQTLILYTCFTSLVFLFYNFTRSTIGDFSGQTYSRYWVGFQLTLVILLLVTISIARVSVTYQQESSFKAGLFLPIFLMSFLILTSIPQGYGEVKNPSSWVNRTDGEFAGAITQDILPDRFSISTSEMNTFGLMIDRYVIDLWGYTNRDIAASKVCNADRIKNNENFFLDNRPDIYWPYWFTTDSQKHNFDTVEESLATFHHTSKQGNLLGDMNKVLMNYDVFFIKNKGGKLAYIVRQELSDSLINHLKGKEFKLLRTF
jgi:hypothetical protein